MYIYVHDRESGNTELASVSSDGEPANDGSVRPTVSYDGRYVTFDSDATNLDPSATDGRRHRYLHDRQTGKTSMVVPASYEGMTITSGSARLSNTKVPMLSICIESTYVARDLNNGTERNMPGCPQAFSGDGRLVAFLSQGRLYLYDWEKRESESII
jgi:hypothetical protein